MLVPNTTKTKAYKQYNAGHVPDLIKPGDSAWGTDWLGESKVPSPLRASAPPARLPAHGPHPWLRLHGGAWEEPLRRTVFGCRERFIQWKLLSLVKSVF